MKMFAVMMRNNGLALSAALFLLLAAGGCKAQTTKASDTLSDATIRRIQNEIRSRYSVPPQVDISVSSPDASDVPGYDKVVITFMHEAKKTTFDFLVSKDRKTLARLEKFDISTDWMSKIDVKGRPSRGSEQAKVVVVSYQDFECPFCSKMHATLFTGPLLQEYAGKVKVIYKDYPLTEIHPWALHAAVDANCLADQNQDAYWDFADYVFANQKQVGGRAPEEAFLNLDKSALEQGIKHKLNVQKLVACTEKQDESAVRKSMAEGLKVGVDSTPTLFINGERVSGAVPADDLRGVFNRVLAEHQ